MKSYEHYSLGDVVRLKDGVRRAPVNDDLREAGEGTIASMTNAGFAGLIYGVMVTNDLIGSHYCPGIPAGDLELVSPVPVRAWPGQTTYRGGRAVAR